MNLTPFRLIKRQSDRILVIVNIVLVSNTERTTIVPVLGTDGDKRNQQEPAECML